MTDWTKISGDLERLLKLRSHVFGMKLFESRAEMEAIPRIRRPKSVHTLDQVVGQASRLGWTVGITAEDLVGAQCRAVVGLGNAKDEAWRSGKHMVGVWYSSEEDASAHREPVHPVLCRAPLWRRPRRRDADGIAARLAAEGDRRDGGAGEKRVALPVPAIRHSAGCARRHGGQLSRPGLTGHECPGMN